VLSVFSVVKKIKPQSTQRALSKKKNKLLP
jgi:hypothetical protein